MIATPVDHHMTADVMQKAMKLCLAFPPLRRKIIDHNLPFSESVIWMAWRIQVYRTAWEQHPQFALWCNDPELSWMRFDDPSWAMVVMALKHPPGRYGREYSFVVCSLDDLPAALQWASTPKVGEFAGILPISAEFTALPYRFALHSFSTQGKAQGYLARQELKRLLPPKLRKYVTRYRTASRGPKWHYLQMPLRCNHGEVFVTYLPEGVTAREWLKSTPLPEWYKQRTKADLWVEHIAHSDPVFYAQLSYWIAPLDFYRAVTGQVHPDQVRDLFIRLPRRVDVPVQMSLF